MIESEAPYLWGIIRVGGCEGEPAAAIWSSLVDLRYFVINGTLCLAGASRVLTVGVVCLCCLKV